MNAFILLKLRANGLALALLAYHEEQAERVANGFLEAEKIDLCGALDAIEAWLTFGGDGMAVLQRAKDALTAWEAYSQKAMGVTP